MRESFAAASKKSFYSNNNDFLKQNTNTEVTYRKRPNIKFTYLNPESTQNSNRNLST